MMEVSEFVRSFIHNPQTCLVIGNSSSVFLQELQRSFENLVETSITFSSYLNTNFERPFDLTISLNTPASSSQERNSELLMKLANDSRLVIFSSNVPCFASKEPSFWPSYWIRLLDVARCECSTDLKSRLWYNRLVPPNVLEGLITFYKTGEFRK
jgi:hypothetical protein